MLVPIKGVKTYTVKGVPYHYHRKTGARIREVPGTAAFVVKVAELDAKVVKKPVGTVGAAVDAYMASRFFKRLAPRTKEGYARAFTEIRKAAAVPIADITTAEIVDTQDDILATNGRWLANYYVTVFALVFKHARRMGLVSDNPARDIEKIERDRKVVANREWTPAECRAVLDAAAAYLAVPIGLAMFAGFRKADVLTLEWSAMQDGWLIRETKKTGALVRVPLHPTLRNILSAAPPGRGHRCMACNSRGRAWTSSGFDSTFGKFIERLKREGKVADGLTMHGLRHTIGTRLDEAGIGKEDRKKLLGHDSDAMANHYARNAEVSPNVVAIFSAMPIAADPDLVRQFAAKSLIKEGS